MGPQWFYLSLVDIAIVGYLLYTYQNHFESVKSLFSSSIFYILLAFLLWATLSGTWAFNSTETWVCLVRLFITLVAFTNLYILFYGNKSVMKGVTYILTAILLFQSLQSMSLLFSQMGGVSFTEIVLGMRGNAGNKNIYAASLMIKIPFALYGLLSIAGYRKIFFLASFSVGTLVIVLLNSRTTYLSYLIVVAFTILFALVRILRAKQYKILYKPLVIIIPGILALLVSQALISSTKYNFGDESAFGSQYGTTAERMGSIVSDKDESRNQRLAFWQHAISYTKAHPLKGAGYDVVEAVDGVDGLNKARTKKFDCVVTDVNMPNMDGISFVTASKQIAAYKFTPVIMLTTEAGEEMKAKGKAIGVRAWVVKPFQPPALLDAVAKLIQP
jgi:two-component system chemotaxis response regulator CheY